MTVWTSRVRRAKKIAPQGRRGRRMKMRAFTSTYILYTHMRIYLLRRNTGNLFSQVGSCVTSRRLQKRRDSSSPLRPLGPMQHTTLAYHTYFVPEHFMSARLARYTGWAELIKPSSELVSSRGEVSLYEIYFIGVEYTYDQKFDFMPFYRIVEMLFNLYSIVVVWYLNAQRTTLLALVI